MQGCVLTHVVNCFYRWRASVLRSVDGASPAASMTPNPMAETKRVLMSIVDPFGVSRKSIHSR